MQLGHQTTNIIETGSETHFVTINSTSKIDDNNEFDMLLIQAILMVQLHLIYWW